MKKGGQKLILGRAKVIFFLGGDQYFFGGRGGKVQMFFSAFREIFYPRPPLQVKILSTPLV